MILLVLIEQTPFTEIIAAASSDPLWYTHFSELWAIEKGIFDFSFPIVMDLLTERAIISTTVWSGCVGVRFISRSSSTRSFLGFRWSDLNQSSSDIQIQLHLC